MRGRRVDAGVQRGAPFQIDCDGAALPAHPGETIAGALIAAGRWPGYFCGMGVCWGCLVEVEGTGQVRACTAVVAPGMRICTVSE